jgi:very-short-patch-repair endonuclease
MREAKDKGWRKEAPPLQGRGKGWGLSVERLAALHGHAREMRRQPTEPEKRLWRQLSNRQLSGFKFRRQAVIGPFIVDFLCPQKALVVEVDGETHIDAGADARRDAALASMGFRVLRVTNDDVFGNMDGVLVAILNALEAAPDRWDNPHPNPSPEGEGLTVRFTNPSPSGEGQGVGNVSIQGSAG